MTDKKLTFQLSAKDENSQENKFSIHSLVLYSSKGNDDQRSQRLGRFFVSNGFPLSFLVTLCPEFILSEHCKLKGQEMPGKTARKKLEESKKTLESMLVILQITFDTGFVVMRRLIRARSRILSLTYSRGILPYLIGKTLFTVYLGMPDGPLLRKGYEQNLLILAKMGVTNDSFNQIVSAKTVKGQKEKVSDE